MNQCKWLGTKSSTCCNKPCKGEFCGAHAQSIRRGSSGPIPCLRCGVGVRGKTQLCAACGGKRYRELKRYYNKKNNDSALTCEQDYLNKFSDKL